MLKKTITYTDYSGNERTEDFFFNLSKAELIEMENSVAGGWLDAVSRIIAAQDNVTIMREFKKFIMAAYGEKSSDGKRFVKSPELSKAFTETEAYSELFMELYLDAAKAADFVIGVVPAEFREAVQTSGGNTVAFPVQPSAT